MTSTFDVLVTALSECDESKGYNKDALLSWPDVNSDVIVPENDNRGSPLLIACELDLPYACKILISRGADVNYRHPSSHGNDPLLRCADMGYDMCLKELLEAPDIDVVVLTREYKLVLGQNIPQYEAGGRSALLLAIESARVGAVDILLQDEEGRRLLKLKDSFGRLPLDAAFEQLALREGKCCREQEKICRLICIASSLDFDNAKLSIKPTAEEAKRRKRERNVELRARYLRNSNVRKEAEVARGLDAVQTKYEPLRLHREVYDPQFHLSSLLLDIDAVSWTARNSDIAEPVSGTFTFPLLSKEHCDAIYEELLHYEKIALEQTELGLPLHVRHDGNFGSLQHCGFLPLLKAIEAIFQPLVSSMMPEKGKCEVYHAFLTRNHMARDENVNAGFKVHCDKSDLTFNICLRASDDMEGSTVGFYSNPSEAGLVPTEENRVYTHVHEVGRAIMHGGRQWHKTDPIVRGKRSSLVVWARHCGSDCSECGAAMGTSWRFCKQCGHETEKR